MQTSFPTPPPSVHPTGSWVKHAACNIKGLMPLINRNTVASKCVLQRRIYINVIWVTAPKASKKKNNPFSFSFHPDPEANN